MNRVLKRTLIVLLVAGFLVSGLSVYAGPGEWSRGKGQGWASKLSEEERAERRARMHERLGLSEEQQAKMESNRQAHQAKRDELRKALEAKREELRTELKKADLDMAGINSLKAELKDLEGQKIDNLVAGILEVRDVLTPEQFAEFQKFAEQHRERRKEKRTEKKGLGKEKE